MEDQFPCSQGKIKIKLFYTHLILKEEMLTNLVEVKRLIERKGVD